MVCKNGKELVNYLATLGEDRLAYSLSTTYSEDVESGCVDIHANDDERVIEIVGSSDDV